MAKSHEIARTGNALKLSADKIVMLPVSEVRPYEKNPRKNADAVKFVKASIEQFGFKVPIIIDSNRVVVCGHTRLLAAKSLGMSEVPCIMADDLTDDQIRAFRLADNKVGEFAEWDMDLLGDELDAIADACDIDMGDFGFDLSDEDEESEVVEDEVPEEVEPVCQKGEIWLLGEHRLMCGDSTDADAVAKLMNGEVGELLFTSPPYSDMREYRGGKDLDPNHLARFVQVYAPYAKYEAVNLGLQMKEYEIFPYWDVYIDLAHDVGLKLLAWNVWDKTTIGSIRAQKQFFPLRHEWIFVFGKAPKKLNKYIEKKTKYDPNKTTRLVRNADGHMRESSIGDCSNPYKTIESVLAITPEYSSDARHLHPAVFPVALPTEYIKSLTKEGDIVVEPFGGSGTTTIACEQLGRKCRMMELDPHYCDVIIARWEKLTGQKAVRL